MARIDKRNIKIKFDYTPKNLNDCYREICSMMNRTVAEMLEDTNRHSKTVNIHSLMSLCKYFGLKFHADFANETIEIITHKGGGAAIEVTKEDISKPGKVVDDEFHTLENVNEIEIPEDEEEDDPF